VSPDGRPRVLALRCRACSGPLPAASNDVAFRCPQCGRGWEIIAGELSECPSVYVAPPVTESGPPILYLPYWSFSVQATAEPLGDLEEAKLTARDRAAKMKRAWVAAHAVYRPTYVGEWGLTYTRIQPRWEPRRGHGPQSPGATISTADAASIARHYVLAEIDRAADIGGLDVKVDLGAPELWAIPCQDLGSQLRCPWTRAEIPASALDDLSEIRSARERLEA